MKEIIPIKKEFIFNTIIGEITDISLDYDYKIKEELIEGNLDISGSYKMTEASVITEDFFYRVPFSVAISKRIKQDTINLEIDDFKYTYEKDKLKADIELLLTCEEDIEETFNIDEYFNEIEQENINDLEIKEEQNYIEEPIELNNIDNLNINNITNNITNNIINDEKKYYKYKVYIIRQNDTLDSICNKYNISINELKEYNNIEKINIGDKLIIPYINE